MDALTYIFKIELKCEKCDETQILEGTISDILSQIYEAGWPICPECGDEMYSDFDVI